MILDAQQRQQLRRLIGSATIYNGKPARVIEFLEQEQALVLHLSSANRQLQDDQYGEPGRQVATTVVVPLFDPVDQEKPNPQLAQLRFQ